MRWDPSRVQRLFTCTLVSIGVLFLFCTGCELAKSDANGGHSVAIERQSLDGSKLTIGYVKDSVLTGLRARGEVERSVMEMALSVNVEVLWLSFEDDVELFQAIQRGVVDVGAVGDGTAALLYNARLPLVSLAAEPANPHAHGIVVPLDSELFQTSDLRNKKVAYTPNTSEHVLLLQALDAEGLSIDDVQSVAVSPSEIPNHFKSTQADAWVVAEPQLSMLDSMGIRMIRDGTDFAGNREIYFTTPENVEVRDQLIETVLEQIQVYEDWIVSDVHDVAELLFEQTEIEHNIWLASFDRKLFGTAPMLDSIVEEQQQLVDILVRLRARKNIYEVRGLLH